MRKNKQYKNYLALINQGQWLFDSKQYAKAVRAFESVLHSLNQSAHFERCFILNQLGRCYDMQGYSEKAVDYYYQSLTIAEKLEPDEKVKKQISFLQADLGTALAGCKQYKEAELAYLVALAIATEQNNTRFMGVVYEQLGTLASSQRDSQSAINHYTQALTILQPLKENALKANIYCNLGMEYQQNQEWAAAEQAYKHSAQFEEAQGNFAGVAEIWNNLATVNQSAGNYVEAEAWYRKAITSSKRGKHKKGQSIILTNLANLIQSYDMSRLAEAQQLAEQALAIDKTQSPADAEIWKNYNMLAGIAEKQGNKEVAKNYLRQARQTYSQSVNAIYHLQGWQSWINKIITAIKQSTPITEELKEFLRDLEGRGGYYKRLATAISHIFTGERDCEKLCDDIGLVYEHAAVVKAILDKL